MMKYCKLEVYVPEGYANSLKKALAAAGAGKLGTYDSCIWECSGTGQFRPLSGSTPFLGTEGQVETVAEIKLEMIVECSRLDAVLKTLRAAHPYETPAFQYWPVSLGSEHGD